jgi:hypothetical protein
MAIFVAFFSLLTKGRRPHGVIMRLEKIIEIFAIFRFFG